MTQEATPWISRYYTDGLRLGGRDVSEVAPTDGQAIVWDNAAQTWKPGNVAGGGGTSFPTGLSIGATPALTGDVRMSHGETIKGRDSTNAADRTLLDWGATTANTLTLGDASVATNLRGALIQSLARHYFQSGITLGLTGYATTGTVQAPHGFTFYARDSGNANNRLVLDFGATSADTLTVGDTNTNTTLRGATIFVFGTLSYGTSAAQSGAWRVPHGWQLKGRDNANLNDRIVLDWGTIADSLSVGDGNAGCYLWGTVVTTMAPFAFGLTVASAGDVRAGTSLSIKALDAATDRSLLSWAANALTLGDSASALTIASSGVTMTGSFLSIGASPAATGALRLPYNTAIYNRNAGNTADLLLVGSLSGTVQLGSYSALTALLSSSSINLLGNSGLNLSLAVVTRSAVIHSTVLGSRPTIFGCTQLGSDTAAVSASLMGSQPFASAVTNKGSGDVRLEVCAPVAGGTYGGIQFYFGSTQTTLGTKSLEVTFDGTNSALDFVNAATATTVGAAGGASALPATPTGYLVIKVAGTQRKIPFYAM